MSSITAIFRGVVVAIGLLACGAATPVTASVIYQSAGYSGIDNGDYTLSSNNLIGAAFQLTATTVITGIGAQFGAFNDGTIFAAIVPLASLTAFPRASPGQPSGSNDLSGISLANVVFSVPSGTTALDLIVPLTVTLAPGTYAVVFGSGQFGADGDAGLGDSNNPLGSPNLFQSIFAPDWATLNDPGVRIVVEGVTATPLPATLPLFATGLSTLGLLGWRRKRKCRSLAA